MAEIVIKIPEDIKDFIDTTSETIYVEALKEIARKKIDHILKNLNEIKEKISYYEKKYNKSYEEYSKTVPDTLEGHDDWIEWQYLVKLAKELSYKIEKFKLLIGKK